MVGQAQAAIPVEWSFGVLHTARAVAVAVAVAVQVPVERAVAAVPGADKVRRLSEHSEAERV